MYARLQVLSALLSKKTNASYLICHLSEHNFTKSYALAQHATYPLSTLIILKYPVTATCHVVWAHLFSFFIYQFTFSPALPQLVIYKRPVCRVDGNEERREREKKVKKENETQDMWYNKKV